MQHLATHLLWFSLLISTLSMAKELKPFNSDGCSAFPEGNFEHNQLWLKCCVQHDFSYWKGGTFTQRVQADLELKECVTNVGEPEIALLMLAGVRVGGTPFLPTTFRWGYGWRYPTFYKPLTWEEQQQIQNAIEQLKKQPANIQPLELQFIDLKGRTKQ